MLVYCPPYIGAKPEHHTHINRPMSRLLNQVGLYIRTYAWTNQTPQDTRCDIHIYILDSFRRSSFGIIAVHIYDVYIALSLLLSAHPSSIWHTHAQPLNANIFNGENAAICTAATCAPAHCVVCVYSANCAHLLLFITHKPEQYKIRGCKVRRTFAIYI